jgi:membrane-bound lytic murein transglycosylase D
MKLSQKPLLFLSGGVIAILFVAGIFAFRKSDAGESSVDVKADGRLQYKWYIPPTPTAMSFAGEKVPLDRQDVREQFDREILNNYYSTIGTLSDIRLSTRYFPMIEERLKANGIPDDFKYLCVAESSLINQTSRAGAVGFWQFMKDTAPKYGLEVNDEVDERYNVLKATDAACMYFKEAYARFGSWTAAAASYNCGMGGYNTQAVYQRTNNYYELLLPEETMRYVFRILALKYYITQGANIGFIVLPSDAYKPNKVHTVTITETIPDLEQYAIDNGINYRTLKWFNPWMRGHTLTIKDGKTYNIDLPLGNR